MLRARVVLFGIGAFAAFGACTTFDGLSARSSSHDAGPDAGADSGLPTYLSIGDAAHLCSLIATCPLLDKSINYSVAVALDKINYSLCMDWLAGPVSPTRVGIAIQSAALGCAAAGTTCKEAAACLSQEFIDPNDPRCAGLPDGGTDASTGFYERCADNGQSVFRCDPRFVPDVLHCNSATYGPGATCVQGSDGTKECALAPGCPKASCAGNLLQFCSSTGLQEVTNCAAAGYSCGHDVTVSGGDPTCLTSDRVKNCTTMGTDCAGDVLSVCDGFQWSEFDCAALGGTCSKLGGTARCKRDGDECAPEDQGINACNGTKITLCIGGKKTQFDCSSVGLDCIPGNQVVTGRCG